MVVYYTCQVRILPVLTLALPAACYVFSWLGDRRSLAEHRRIVGAVGLQDDGTRLAAASLPALLLFVGLLLHAVSLYFVMLDGSEFRFGFAQALSATLLVGVAVLWIEGRRVRVAALRALILPIAALAVLLPLFFPGSVLAETRMRPMFVMHLLVGTLAYGVLLLAALHAGLMTAAERALHGGPGAQRSIFARLIDELPPLLVLERMLFTLIRLGFLLLTLTAITGIFFTEEIFGRPLRFDHKTVFTLIAWAVFGVLLLGRWLRGWRGRGALRATMAGYGVLLLAYIGTRFVLEVILGRV